MSSISSKSLSQIQVCAEDKSKGNEIDEKDVISFAALLGVDLEKEPHLRPIIEEGLLAPLPQGWKPCKDLTRDVWYYFNESNGETQWEHPLNEVYKYRIIEFRQEKAMNRIKELDFVPTKKALPPLKKIGASRPPQGIAVLGGNGNREPTTSNSPFQQVSFKSLSIDLEELDKQAEEEAINEDFAAPSPLILSKKTSGLVLTGSGANFLKGTTNTNAVPQPQAIGLVEQNKRQDDKESQPKYEATETPMVVSTLEINSGSKGEPHYVPPPNSLKPIPTPNEHHLKDQDEKQIQELKDSHKSRIDMVKKQFESELERIKEEYETRMIKLRSQLAEQVSLLQNQEEENKIKIQETKAKHARELQDLEKRYRNEQTKLSSEHEERIAFLRSQFASDTENLEKQLKSEQNKKLESLKAEFDKERATVEREVKAGILGLRHDLNGLQEQVNKSPSKVEQETNKSKTLTSNYERLKNKYLHLKKEMKRVVHEQKIRKEEEEKANRRTNNKNSDSGSVLTEDSEENSTTLYPSSTHKNKVQESSPSPSPEEEGDGDDDKLQSALKSLEQLRQQIVEIQKEKGTKSSRPKVATSSRKPSNLPQTLSARASIPNTPRSGPIRFTNNRLRAYRSTPALNESPKQIMKDAKELLKSQKELLRPVRDYKLLTSHQIFNSETDSTSGIGSMSERKRANIAKDIDVICNTLHELDSQMKFAWQMAMGPQNVSSNSLITQKPSNFVDFHLQSSYPSHSNPYSPLLTSTPLRKPTPSQVLTSLDKDLEHFRILKQRLSSQYTTKSSNENIQDRTKDLREWLDKF